MATKAKKPKKSSPKLKEVTTEIVAILKKHNVAASIALSIPGFEEHLLHLMPSFSQLKPTPDGNGLPFRSSIEDYGGSGKLMRVDRKKTAEMIGSLFGATGQNMVQLQRINTELNKVGLNQPAPELLPTIES